MEKELVYSWLLIGPLGFEEWVLGDTGKVVRRPVQKSKKRVDESSCRFRCCQRSSFLFWGPNFSLLFR